MRKRNAGFTMLELIMVVIIIGVLAALAVPQYVSFVEKARAAEALNYIGQIKSAEVAFSAQSAVGNYGNMVEIGMTTNTTPLWSYSATPATNVSVLITASRNGGTEANKTIILNYAATGVGNWAGNHPGKPQ